MIFVTVGTHEQQFNRLVKKIDELKISGAIEEDVFIQTGYSTYEPIACKWSKLVPYQDMIKYVAEARIVITHGGPSSFIMPLQVGKIPIVVPRLSKYDEHVNDHQHAFCKAVEERQGNIIFVDDVDMLLDIILNYDKKIASMPTEMKSNNKKFCEEFEKIVSSIFK